MTGLITFTITVFMGFFAIMGTAMITEGIKLSFSLS
jgi:hypothetical protein